MEKYLKPILDYIYSIYGFENTTKLNLIIGFHSVDKKEEKYNFTHPQPVPSNQDKNSSGYLKYLLDIISIIYISVKLNEVTLLCPVV